MSQTENQKKLLKILNEIFQLDQSDLDFGIYRIINSKSKEINEFLDNDLLSSVASAFSSNDNSSIQKELDGKVKSFREDGFTEEQIDNNTKVIALREQLSSTTTSSNNLENDVFSHLAIFFKRYYKDGDFVSLRRYKKDTYAIPYEGEEVKLHWANSDQYYIKSGEYFRDYTFIVNDKTIHLKLSDAETESNNNKATSDKERRFLILEDNPCEVIDDELYINFEYKAIGKENQDKLNESAIAKALESIEGLEFPRALNELAPTEKNKTRTIFEKHLKSYTSRNSFDYFIHKDLGGFLGRELDFYIKNEMLFLDDIMDSPIKYEEVINKIKIFKKVSKKVIDFLNQLEELQKRLWEKKKFIIETNYCITLDKIIDRHSISTPNSHSVLDTESPRLNKEMLNQVQHDSVLSFNGATVESILNTILENKEQLAEWKTLFDVDVQSVDDLKKEKYLVLDTKFFDTKFKYKLLSEFDNLDEDIDGVLINSENFGALSLLQDRYKEQVKTVYIDPPYNTEKDRTSGRFIYKDGYDESSWLSFLIDRIELANNINDKDGSLNISIGDDENSKLIELVKTVYGKDKYLGQFIWMKGKEGGNDNYGLGIHHEYIISFSKGNGSSNINLDEKDTSRHKTELKEKNLVKKHEYIYKNGEPFQLINLSKQKDYRLKIPMKDGSIFEWEGYLPQNTLDDYIIKGKIFVGEKQVPYVKSFLSDEKDGTKPSTLIEQKYGTTKAGGIEIKSLFNSKPFQYPKPSILLKRIASIFTNKEDIVLDYFAGSGTTGHGVINLNREDNGKRKYILVEMGEYFDSVTKPRIQKVIYTDSWKDGKSTTKNGVSQIFKYFKLESYEDALNNLEFKRTKEQEDTLGLYPQAKEDYMLNYSLNVESQASLLNIDTFKTPFDYKLKITTSSVGETKDTAIDLVETFNYLLGLVVEKIKLENGFLTVKGKNLKGSKIFVIWRDNKTSDELDDFVKDVDLDIFDDIYVNGDNHLTKVKLIEHEFKKLMFGE